MGKLGIIVTLALLLAGTAGCPKNTCFLEVCSNGVCRCHVSSCVDGAEYDTTQKRCQCIVGRLPVAGQCLTQAAADAYCGTGFRHGPTGCLRITCEADAELDEATGACIPREKVSEVASNVGVEVGEGEKLGCPPGSELVIEGNTAACVPLDQTCAPDESWDGQACRKLSPCPTGSRWDPTQNRCIQFATTGDDAAVVDVNQWALSSYGPNGGQGSAPFCSQFARKPWRFGVPEGQSTLVQVAVQLSFPDNNVTAGTVMASPSYVGVPTPVPPKGVEAIQSAAESLFAPLRQGGGRANATQATTTVRCAIVNAAKPVAVPATGGF